MSIMGSCLTVDEHFLRGAINDVEFTLGSVDGVWIVLRGKLDGDKHITFNRLIRQNKSIKLWDRLLIYYFTLVKLESYERLYPFLGLFMTIELMREDFKKFIEKHR